MAHQSDNTNFDPEWAAQDRGPALLAVLCVLTPLSTIFCGMRLYTRGWIMGKLYSDDYFIAFSVVCALLSMGLSIKAVIAGDGKHFVVLSDSQKGDALLYSIASLSPSVLSFAIPKLGVVALLVRLLNPSRFQRIFLWTLVIVCAISAAMCNVLMFAQCRPTKALWDITVTEKECWDPYILVNYSIYAGTFSACTDLYLAVYPAIVLFGLQMKLKKKIVLSAALGIGSIATIVSIIKMTQITLLASTDFTYATCDLAIWTCVEASTLIIAACIPVLQPLFERIFGRGFFGGSTARNYNQYNNSSKNYNDLEMSGRDKKRRPHKDPNGLSFLDQTQLTQYGSEENIWDEPDRKVAELSSAEVSPTMDKPARAETRTHIVRTHSVSVEYGAKPGTRGGKEEELKWKRGF